MKPFPANKNEKNEFSLLPSDTAQALKFLIMISEKLIAIAEKETQVLIQNDMMAFSIIQDEKDALSVRYARASEEFRERLEEFRNADETLIAQLEKLQNQLGEITHSNKEIVSQMFLRSKKNVNESLITAQELAQQKPMKDNAVNGVNGHQEGA